jgi:hypothetical protein
MLARLRRWASEADRLRSEAARIDQRRILTIEFFRSHGFDLGNAPAPEDHDSSRRLVAQFPAPVSNLPGPDELRDLSIGEAAYRTLKAVAPKGLHANALSALFENYGILRGTNPLATLLTALRRDARIEKVPDERNLWRAVKHVVPSEEAVSSQ